MTGKDNEMQHVDEMLDEMRRIAADEMFDELVRQQLQKQAVNESDYVDEESGLLICGTCGEPKREYVTAPDGTHKVEVPIMCRCEREEKAKADADITAQKVIELRRSANIPPSMERMTFDTIDVTDENRKNVEMCREYAEKFIEPARDGSGYRLGRMYRKGKGLLLCGASGTGKTCLAVCIANYLLQRCVSVAMVSLPSYMAAADKSGAAASEMLAKIDAAALAIFDDYGAERSTEYAAEKAYELINSRYNSGCPMIVTTNYTLRQMLEERSIERTRINDRIYQVCLPIEFSGKSRRRSEAAKAFHNPREFFDG